MRRYLYVFTRTHIAPMFQQDKIIHLRNLIARHTAAPVARSGQTETGIASLDDALAGGLWKGGIVELVGAARSAGSSTLVRALMREFAARGRWSALVDGSDSFDPRLAGAAMVGALAWFRCRSADEAMRSADMLARDGNLPLIVLDLRSVADAQLRRIASTVWYRLQRTVEPTDAALLVFTPRPLVPCADARVELHEALPLEALHWEPADVPRRTTLRVTRRRAPAAFGFGGGNERNLITEAG